MPLYKQREIARPVAVENLPEIVTEKALGHGLDSAGHIIRTRSNVFRPELLNDRDQLLHSDPQIGGSRSFVIGSAHGRSFFNTSLYGHPCGSCEGLEELPPALGFGLFDDDDDTRV